MNRSKPRVQYTLNIVPVLAKLGTNRNRTNLDLAFILDSDLEQKMPRRSIDNRELRTQNSDATQR